MAVVAGFKRITPYETVMPYMGIFLFALFSVFVVIPIRPSELFSMISNSPI